MENISFRGAPMGAKFSPSFANIYMTYWEEHYIFNISNPFFSSIKYLGRYIDDLVLVWRDSETRFQEFMLYINDNDLNLRFTSQFSATSIPFLDIMLCAPQDQSENKMIVKPYRKESAGNTILQATSCHPRHVTRNIPYGEWVRLRRNCLQDEVFEQESVLLHNRLRARGYDDTTLKNAYEKAKELNRVDLIASGSKKSSKRNAQTKNKLPVCVTSYSKQFRTISNILQKYLPILENDNALFNYDKSRIRVVSRRGPFLGSKLSPSLFLTSDKGPSTSTWLTYPGTWKCGNTQCITCSHIAVSDSFISFSTGQQFSNKTYANCNTTSVVYLASCCSCQCQYVGCMSNALKVRIRRYIADAKNNQFNISPFI
ncbi:proheparin-binding EGF-like growth factor isoform X1 [Hyla sarda]|uniref:proheparin-binding EGF-like growth factor isoform X1 n=1 Tax=Hyla sarda TaxID=327740 RepID=UPI0024C320AD|nr:proheparin-binding EGF-like growth factor isoform X1 [Hyla sarda]XP_056372515.1 proheparin-binding EGF-like growth factor isoform X1 [Hyla sarda]